VGYPVAHIDDMEAVGPGGAVRLVRREVGVETLASGVLKGSASRKHL
jgi:hypothetical protein